MLVNISCFMCSTLPRAMGLMMSLMIVIYLLVNVGYMTVLSKSQILQSQAVAVVRIQSFIRVFVRSNIYIYIHIYIYITI